MGLNVTFVSCKMWHIHQQTFVENHPWFAILTLDKTLTHTHLFHYMCDMCDKHCFNGNEVLDGRCIRMSNVKDNACQMNSRENE